MFTNRVRSVSTTPVLWHALWWEVMGFTEAHPRSQIFPDTAHKMRDCPWFTVVAGHYFARFLWQTVFFPLPRWSADGLLLFKHCKSTQVKYGTMFWNRRIRATLSPDVSHKFFPRFVLAPSVCLNFREIHGHRLGWACVQQDVWLKWALQVYFSVQALGMRKSPFESFVMHSFNKHSLSNYHMPALAGN